jgi:hypothetical protein
MKPLLLLTLSLSLFAADPPKVEPPKPPVITDKEVTEYFKLQFALQLAKNQLEQADKNFKDTQRAAQDHIAAMMAKCGKDFTLTAATPTDEPRCVAKPVTATK